MHVARLLVIGTVALVVATGAGAAPSFELVFDGKHDTDLLHEGSFTSSASWCPSGSAVDIGVDAATDTASRRFSCTTGGDFTAKVHPLPAEHGGNGVWQIVAGTGPLANLRGKGTFTSTRLEGRSDDPATITFRSTWSGAAAFDVTPPVVTIGRASVRKVARSKRTYSLRLAMSLTDAGGGVVSYTLQVVDPRKPYNAFVYKVGEATRSVTVAARLKVPKRTHVLRIELDASDAVGNASTAAKTITLR